MSRQATPNSKAALKARSLRGIDRNGNAAPGSIDPHSALRSLRALLEDKGHGKRQMTPEEHRMTLKLLDIVEPFVGSTPAKKNLVAQPNEILDEIVFHIDSKRDLLAFALTCDRMYRVIHPRHYEYRVIRTKISSISVWQHLLDNKALARGVRNLEVLDERSNELQIVPSGIERVRPANVVDIHKYHEELLVRVIESLPTLTRFTWACGHSPISISNLWNSLILCDSLQDVELADNLLFGQTSDTDAMDCITSASRLRSVNLRSSQSNFALAKNPSLQTVSKMLVDRCPNLETLHIGYEPRRVIMKPRADDFVSQGRWSQLRSLTLRSVWCSAQNGIPALVSFLADHNKLEVLSIDIGRFSGNAIHLPPNTLPSLREVTSSKELATAIMDCPLEPESHTRPLEVIKGFGLSGPAHDAKFFEALRKCNIKRIELARFNDIDDIRRLVDCVPKLTWLDVGIKENYKTGPLTIPNAGEWAAMLSPLAELAAFHGVHMFYDSLLPEKEGSAITHSDRSKVVKNNETANVLAWKLPKLRRLDHWEDGSGKIVVIVREGEKIRWEVRRVVKA